MTHPSLTVRPERPDDAATLDALTWSVFGPGMTARAAYALREGVEHEMALSFVAEMEDEIIGTVRLTKILIGDEIVLMLGPLAVLRAYKNQGAGRLLMARAVEAARQGAEHGGPKAIMLVGDEPYYGPFGFRKAPLGSIQLPRPTDSNRILVCPLAEEDLPKGTARRLR